MILESRDLAGANAAHERSCVGAPLEAVQEENLEVRQTALAECQALTEFDTPGMLSVHADARKSAYISSFIRIYRCW